jgi:N-acyl-D-amino-acid deacylase
VVERATYDDPLRHTEGFQYVLVGGTVAVEDGAVTDHRNGTVLRSGREWDGASRPTLDRRAESGQ